MKHQRRIPFDDAWYRAESPDASEIQRRTDAFFRPYHDGVARELASLKRDFKHVLFYDAHSIQRVVPTIRPEPFKDLILGDQNGKTAAKPLIDCALAVLERSGRTLAHNDPFMGGYLTRSIGKPETGIHALQLEMVQNIYMNEAKAERDPAKMQSIQAFLQPMLTDLAAVLGRLP